MTSTQDREDYIARIREAREKADLKQEDIARHIGVDRPTYTNYEKRRAMPQKYIAKFCEITGVRIAWLLTGEMPMKKPDYTQPENDSAYLFEKLIETVKDPFVIDMLKTLKKKEMEK